MMLKPWPLLLLASAVALAEPGSVTRNTDMKDRPFLDGATVVQLSAGSIVEIQKRQGAWMQVKTKEGKTGWVKLLNIRSGTAAAGGGGFAGQVLLGMRIAKTGSSGNTVTTGVKGLSAEQIKNAKPNPAELARLQELGVSESDARQFALQSKLIAQSVDPINVAQ